MIEILKQNYEIIAGFVAGIIGYFGGLKLKKINENQAHADFTKTTQEIYEKLAEQMQKKIDEMQAEIDNLRTELKKYTGQCSNCPNNKYK